MTNKHKCLIVGGAGFLGLNLALYLKERNIEVDVIDNFCYSNIYAMDILQNNNIKIIYRDILDANFTINLLKEYSIVLNLATSPVVNEGFYQQELLLQSTMQTTQTILQCASHSNQLDKVILISNLHVYGETKPYKTKFKEDSTLNPICPLGSIKLSEEIVAKTLAKAYKIKLAVLRVSECFGPFMKITLPCSQFVNMATSAIYKTKCVIPNDGEDIVDYLYVGDFCEAVFNIINQEQSNLINTYNICSGKGRTYNDIYLKMYYAFNEDKELYKKLVDHQPIIYPLVSYIVGNHAKATRELKWKPSNNFDELLMVSIGWIYDELNKLNNVEMI